MARLSVEGRKASGRGGSDARMVGDRLTRFLAALGTSNKLLHRSELANCTAELESPCPRMP